MSNSDSEESTCSGRSYRKNVIPSSAYRLSRLKNVGGTLEKPAELFRKDLISAMKLPDTECLFPEDYILISDPWRQDWEKGVQVPVNPEMEKTCRADVIKENESMYGSYGFKMPKKLLHAVADDAYKQSLHELHETHKLAEEVCRYDLDHLDEIWLKSYNDIREQCGEEELSGWSMENIIEELETRCYGSLKAAEAAGMEYDEDTVCDVCRMPDVEEGNEMVFCDGCDVGVHQACYGILKIPKGSWVCRTCAVGIKPRCALCTTVGGAMKSTKSGTQWAHLSCAIWIPEVTIEDPEKMEPISKIDLIPMTRLNLICSVCKERSGACVQCCEKKCKTAFHVTCAFKKNFKMKINCEEGELQFKAHCDIHSKNGSPLKNTPELTSEEKKSRLQAIRDEFYLHVTCEEVAKVLGLDLGTVSFVYEYWKLKRKSNFNKPLLAPKVDESAMLVGRKEDGLVARLRMFIHLRQDLERVRNLCYMVIRRERTRNQLQQTKKELFLGQAEALDMEKLKPGSKEYESLRQIHKQNLSIYDRHAEIAKAAKVYETALDLKSKEESDDDEAQESFLSAATPSHSIQNNESSIKTPKMKDKIGIGTPSSMAKSPKGRKRPACDPTENPYARPTYKSFSWMLGTRKKRKLGDAQAESEIHSPVRVKPSASDPVCNLRSKDEVHESAVVSAQSLGDVNEVLQGDPKAGISHEESATQRNINGTANQQSSPAKSSCLEETSFSLPNMMNHSGVNAIPETPVDVSPLDKNKLPEVKENINCLSSARPRKIRTNPTHVKLGRPPKKSRCTKQLMQKEEIEPDDLVSEITKVCENFGFHPPRDVGNNGVDNTSPELLSPPHSSSPDDNISNLLLESCDMQPTDNKMADNETIKIEPNAKKVADSRPISPDDLCYDSYDVFVPDIEKINKPSKKSSPLKAVKGRNCKESDRKITPINGASASKKTKDSQRISRKSSVSGSILSPQRAKRSKDLGSNLVQSTLTISPLFSDKSPSLKSPKVSEGSQDIILKKEGKNRANNSPGKQPMNHTSRLRQKINEDDGWDDFIDPPQLTRPPLENGLPKSNKSSVKLSGKIFDKKNVTPILKSFQATLDSYLKSKDGEKSKDSPEKKTQLKSEEAHHRPITARENEQLIDPLKQVVLKLDRISNFKEKSSPQKFLQPPDKKTLKNSSNLPKRIHSDSGKVKEPRQKYSTRRSSSGRN